ncbi:DUF6807 domain-containing protein [Novipirellula artificiosorum]|uniref:Uncharacterized protein n=1 Tax=Novipirellula artificiosorum TaxID=2528016 RepID=A0A5C6D617_9BACT|nr:PmoA family protein [Novipirellula artificiosorum]TWU32278.1 hypothetical protein Poly41_57630 [Novipirellula artificiosorum]
MKPLRFLCSLFLLLAAALSDSSGQEPRVRCEQTDDAILVSVDGKSALRYNKSIQKPPKNMESVYQRSGYIHPVYSPNGQIVSGDFAPDHAHQHALFGAFVQTTFEGQRLDFWNQLKKEGRVSHVAVTRVESGNQSGTFSVKLLHESIRDSAHPVAVLEEVWTVTAYATGEPAVVFDIESEITCVAESELTINKYHYGGMAFRGSNQWVTEASEKAMGQYIKKAAEQPDLPLPEMEVARHQFLTSDGNRRFKGNASHPKWVSIYGPVDGRLCGMAMLSHPSNFRFPQAVRLHPSKPYFCFAPMVDGAFVLKPGDKLRERYRYVVFDGEPEADMLHGQFDDFASRN